MLIDWFTVGAQAINFIILVWLMKRFLFKPILSAVETRENRIAAELKDAKSKQHEAKVERDEFQKKNDDFEKQRIDLLAKATADASKERERLTTDARKEADDLSEKRRGLLQKEAEDLNEALGARVKDEVFAITRKVLADLADDDLESKICKVFIRRLSEMDADSKMQLDAALKSASEPAIVKSTFHIPKDQCTEIENAFHAEFSTKVSIKFETTPDLISGIEFTVNGQKLAWSIAGYFASLEKSICDTVASRIASKGEPKVELVKAE